MMYDDAVLQKRFRESMELYTQCVTIYSWTYDINRICWNSLYTVRQKKYLLRFFAVLSAIAWNFKAKIYQHM